MTRDELAERLQTRLNNPTYYQQIDTSDSIQDGVDEIVALSGCLPKAVRLPFLQYRTYYDFVTIVSDFLAVTGIFNTFTKRWLNPSSIRRFNAQRPDWDTRYGTPEEFAIVNYRYVAIADKPDITDYGDMYLFYRAQAPVLSGSDSLPMVDEHTGTAEDYSMADLWEQNQEWTKAGARFQDYQKSVALLRSYMSNRISERLPYLREWGGR